VAQKAQQMPIARPFSPPWVIEDGYSVVTASTVNQ
jgi:hypothetical protein